jgi:hypothetical protein
MKKIISLFSVLAAVLLISALPAFSAGTGPYGAFGPTIDSRSVQAVDNTHVSWAGGTGPYGSFGPVEGYNIIPGAENTHMASSWGTGPYGTLNSHGLVARDKSDRGECLLVAMYCPLGTVSK